MQQSKIAVTGQPIKIFNNGNMFIPPVPWTYFSPLGWNAKQIPPGVSDFTYVDDNVEGVTRVIDNPPIGAQNKIPATNFSSGEEEYSANRRREVVNSDGVVEKPVANGKPPVAPYKIYNIGNSSPVPLMECIAAIETALGKTAQKEFLPMQPGDVPRTEADVTDLVENLGYKPNTPVQKGIERFITWYKQTVLP
jgi:UDP-glucuronate 4-epimerase